MNPTLNPTIKWLASALLPAFGTGSAMLAAGIAPTSFVFWWAVAGAVVGGLVGKGATVAGDNSLKAKRQGE